MARPAFKPTDEERKQVEAMSGYGVPHEQIAALIKREKVKTKTMESIDSDTLKKHFRMELIDGKAVYTLSPDEYAQAADKIKAAGAKILGGCCGTTPAHIEAMAKKIRS